MKHHPALEDSNVAWQTVHAGGNLELLDIDDEPDEANENEDHNDAEEANNGGDMDGNLVDDDDDDNHAMYDNEQL
jgi:hypothetical protein